MAFNKLPETFVRRLKEIVQAQNVLLQQAERWTYGYDNSRLHGIPDAVVFPEHHHQVQAIVILCNEYEIPIIPRGRGTGTTGATVPLNGGIIISVERMEKIFLMDPDNRILIVQPGVTNQRIQQTAGQYGFFWPPDPTSSPFCTLGGNLAYNSAGPRAVKYGTARENTLALRAVIGSGDEIRTGVQTTKGVVGYDLTRLLIGSEGTLAIITEATLKLTPLPQEKRLIQAVYKDIKSAAGAVANIMAQPVTPCALEFMDKNALDLLRKFRKVEIPEQAGGLLYIEVDGSEASLDQDIQAVITAAQNNGLLELYIAKTRQERHALWAIRKALSPALRHVAPKKINEDVVVPVSCIPVLVEGLDSLAKEYNIHIVNFGHAGNGNIHVNLLIDPDDPQQMEQAEICLDRIFDLVLSLRGTISGEHGIGLVKRDFVAKELEPAALKLMRQIKAQFDPKNILNPNKGFPPLN